MTANVGNIDPTRRSPNVIAAMLAEMFMSTMDKYGFKGSRLEGEK